MNTACMLVLAAVAAAPVQEPPPDLPRRVSAPSGPEERPEIDPELSWPRIFEREGYEIVIFQPQIDSWEGYRTLEARAAVAIVPLGGEETQTVYGAVRLAADTETDHETHQVLLTNPRITAVRFSAGDPTLTAGYEQIVRSIEPARESVILSLDRVLAGLEAGQQGVRSVDVVLDPPPIIYSGEPAMLLIFMGPPQFEVIDGTRLMYADNTDVDLFFDGASQSFYLLDGDSWLTTHDLTSGPWTVTLEPPAALSRVPDAWKHVKWKIPGQPRGEEVPRIIIAEGPSELIVTDGPPRLDAIDGAGGLYAVSNTDSDVFYHQPAEGTPSYYFLAAGRWFSAPTLLGPWAAATGALPEAFAGIQRESDHAHVLVSVPGTPDAEEAVLMASVPRMATVFRDAAMVQVEYEGTAPELVPVEGTSIHAVVNSPYDVLLVNGVYYCCHQAVWFVSDRYDGPWAVADQVPPEIYQIPPTSPKHHLTYVQVYDATEDTVDVGYTSGYTGEFIVLGALVFGLGYAIANSDNVSWYMHTGSRYYSYGHGVRYDYYRGRYGRGVVARGSHGSAVRWQAYNPYTGTYGRGAARYGPRGRMYARQAYNPRTGGYAARAGASTRYRSWGTSVVARGDRWARAGHASGPRGTVIGAGDSWGRRGFVAKGRYGDVYAGRNGSIYKRNGAGDWSEYHSSRWRPAHLPANPGGRPGRPGVRPPQKGLTTWGSVSGDLNREAYRRFKGNSSATRYHRSSRSRRR